jgi:hypothetical protein
VQLANWKKALHSPHQKWQKTMMVYLNNFVIQLFSTLNLLMNGVIKCLHTRYLEETAANPEEIDLSTFQNFIRIGNEKGLLRSDWTVWRNYRHARSNSSHSYDGNKAEAVYRIAADFLKEAKYLYQQLVDTSQQE